MELIRQHLPRLMRENPQVLKWVRELVAQYGITREEWFAFLERFDRLIEAVERNTEKSRLWEAVRENTQQIQKLWKEISRLWEAARGNTQQISRLWQSFDALREEMQRGFERIHRRITALGAHWGWKTDGRSERV